MPQVTRKDLQIVLSNLLLAIAILWAVASLTYRSSLLKSFSYASYYLILLLFIYWVETLLQFVKKTKSDVSSFLRSNGAGIVFAIVLAGFIFITVKPYFRVLSDETNLLAVSKSMTYERRIDNVTMGKWYYFNFYPMNREMPKRPFLFPFFTHLLHITIGYHAYNPFILNFLILISLFIFVFLFFKEILGPVWGYCAIILLAAQPIVTQTAVSAGFDLLPVLFIFISFLCLRNFLHTPAPMSFQILWANLLMLAHTRYEAPVFFAVTLFFLGIWKYIRKDFFRSSVGYSATPLLLLPILWQQLVEMHEKNTFETDPGVAAFSLQNFLSHAAIFGHSLFRFDFRLPYASIINVTGILSLVYFAFLFLRRQWPETKKDKHLAIIFSAQVILLFVIVNSFHMGYLTHPSNSRYFVTFFSILSLFSVALFHRLKFLRENPAYVVLFSVMTFLIYHPLSIENRFSNTQFLPREYRVVMDYLQEVGHRDFLLVTDRPGQFTVQNFGAVNFEYANKNKDALITELKRHLFREIFVVQEIEYATSLPTKDTSLNSGFTLQPVLELQNKATSFIRISKVIFFRSSPGP